MPENVLLRFALSVADGTPVAWAAHESGLTDYDRRLLTRLQHIAGEARRELWSIENFLAGGRSP